MKASCERMVEILTFLWSSEWGKLISKVCPYLLAEDIDGRNGRPCATGSFWSVGGSPPSYQRTPENPRNQALCSARTIPRQCACAGASIRLPPPLVAKVVAAMVEGIDNTES